MESHHPRSFWIAITMWLVLGSFAWSGCGPGRSMTLPNGYECHIDKAFIMISHPDEGAPGIDDAGDIDLIGDAVIGSRVEWASDQVVGYFILDTKSRNLKSFESLQEWRAELEARGVADHNIRWPGVFFKGVPFGIQLVLWSIPAALLGGLFVCAQSVTRRRSTVQRYG